MTKQKLTLAFLLSTLLLSTPSYADWTYIGTNAAGDKLHLDADRLRKHNGLIYFWDLEDFIKPTDGGLSAMTYRRGDCNTMGYNYLSISVYEQPMGKGKTVTSSNYNDEDWIYAKPGSIGEFVMRNACDFSSK